MKNGTGCFPSAGDLDFGFFMIAIVSGIVLVLPYDVFHPKDSLQVMMLTSRGGVFSGPFYWSAHIFVVMAVFHTIEYLLKCGESKVSKAIWVRLTLAVPAILYVMLSGFILKGDADPPGPADIQWSP